MVLTIDLASATPVYRQIVDGLRVLLVDRRLAPGDSLPSVRRLALDLGVHFNTVAQAYRTLADEGWVEIARRSGARVIDRAAPDGHQKALAADLRHRLQKLIAELRAHGYPPSRLARDLRQAAESLEED